MAKAVAVKVSKVRKTFRIPHERHSTLKQSAVNLFSRKNYTELEAVREADFEVYEGEFFGIVGRNGSGKSTLLKLLAGIYVPSSGKIAINGTLSPFIELGVGFNPELTARENVYLNGALLGLTRRKITAKFADIIGFAELEDFVDQKLKNFSSGMQVRLAFSIAIQAESDILLVDEVLAVGDAAFQKKCTDVFRELKARGRTIIFVTHDMSAVTRFCDRVLVLDKGVAKGLVDAEQAKEIYSQLNNPESAGVMEAAEQNRWGTGLIKVASVKVLGSGGKETQIRTGERMTIEVALEPAQQKGRSLLVGLAFFLADGTHVAGPNSGDLKLTTAAKSVRFEVERLPLVEGDYKMTVALFNADLSETYDFVNKGYSFSVKGLSRDYGLTALFGDWSSDGS